VEVAGIALYLAGSYLNTASEWTRMRWKRAPGHQGKLYTGGLFARSMHVNYFGDMVLFTGFALGTGRYVALLVPLLMTLSFAFVHVPVLDAYLADRYGAEFKAYAERTSRLVPGVW
jgi:steroid 5-alpha reductase family enzyme